MSEATRQIILLSDVTIDELRAALAFSGIAIEDAKKVRGADLRVTRVPSFISKPVECSCDSAKKLEDLKEQVRKGVKQIKAQVTEMGYKVTELAIKLGEHELKKLKTAQAKSMFRQIPTPEELEKRLADIEFWEKLQEQHESSPKYVFEPKGEDNV